MKNVGPKGRGGGTDIEAETAAKCTFLLILWASFPSFFSSSNGLWKMIRAGKSIPEKSGQTATFNHYVHFSFVVSYPIFVTGCFTCFCNTLVHFSKYSFQLKDKTYFLSFFKDAKFFNFATYYILNWRDRIETKPIMFIVFQYIAKKRSSSFATVYLIHLVVPVFSAHVV